MGCRSNASVQAAWQQPSRCACQASNCHTSAGQYNTSGSLCDERHTLGTALSALAIHAHSAENCRRLCENILAFVSDRDRMALHAEFVQLKGLELVLGVVRQHGGPAALAALQILDKLSRTAAREMCAAGGIDDLVRCCEQEEQLPSLIEAALRALLGLSFDGDSRTLLLRRNVKRLADRFVEAGIPRGDPEDEKEATYHTWRGVVSAATRLSQRLADGSRK